MRTFVTLTAALTLLLLPAACSRPDTGPGQAPAGVEIPALGLELATLPEGFVVASSSDTGLVLEPADTDREGSIEITGAPEDLGPNLVEAVRAHQREIEARPGGEYLGARELVGPLGTAFWSRGRYTEDGRVLEEAVVFTLDPRQERIVKIASVYPAGEDSAGRIQALLAVLGELGEASPPASPQPSPGS